MSDLVKGLITVVLGMGLVFLILAVLILAICIVRWFMDNVMNKKKEKKSEVSVDSDGGSNKAAVSEEVAVSSDGDVVAAITAAIAVILGSENARSSDAEFVIRKIRRF